MQDPRPNTSNVLTTQTVPALRPALFGPLNTPPGHSDLGGEWGGGTGHPGVLGLGPIEEILALLVKNSKKRKETGLSRSLCAQCT